MRNVLLVFSVLLVLFSCTKQRKAPQAEPITQRSQPPTLPVGTDTMIYYSRGACFGMCPIFELTILNNGRAVYTGKNHVDRIGRFTAQVSFSDVKHVLHKAEEIGYFQMNTAYDNDKVHDLPDITTYVAHEGTLHKVRNRYKGPASLRFLYNELDTLIEKQQWQPSGSNQE